MGINYFKFQRKMENTSGEKPTQETPDIKILYNSTELDSQNNNQTFFSVSRQYDPINTSLDNLSENSDVSSKKSLKQISPKKDLEKIAELKESEATNEVDNSKTQKSISQKSNSNNLNIPQITCEMSNKDFPYSNPVTFEQTPVLTP